MRQIYEIDRIFQRAPVVESLSVRVVVASVFDQLPIGDERDAGLRHRLRGLNGSSQASSRVKADEVARCDLCSTTDESIAADRSISARSVLLGKPFHGADRVSARDRLRFAALVGPFREPPDVLTGNRNA
jgi:hypothetical protein